jgi:hypothetical protein
VQTSARSSGFGYPMKGGDPMKICGAKTRSGEPCRRAGMRNGRCRLHGGLTPRGSVHPRYVHGRYSRDLPERLAERFADALADKATLVQRAELAVVDVRISDLLGQVDDGGGRLAWKSVTSTFAAIRAARAANDAPGLAAALAAHEEAIAFGSRDSAIWAEIRETIDDRRKLVDSETRRLMAAATTLTAAEAAALMHALREAVRVALDQHDVPDRGRVLASVGMEFARLTGKDPDRDPEDENGVN